MKEQRVEAVERALSIIECFSAADRELTLTEISELTGLYMSTILRLCGSLERYGYIVRRPTGEFRVGPSLWRLGSLYSKGFEQAEVIRPVLREIVEKTKETATFYVREGDDRVCLFRETSPHSLRFDLDEGARLTMDRGAGAHVLRAFSDDARPEDDAIRTAGFAISEGERTPNVTALAVPVLDPTGGIRGALGVSGPTFRLDQDARNAALAVLQAASHRLNSQQ
ncbi:helix-turn-helix domain-containing protein [Pseudooceanicola sp. 216_PA32_1]|uniref:Helix-turn-helix domain-containing protein n=1 Tax=Pseudooceanicola pacificus TaxID=2676438 RepID=A0A844WCK6_9RHOB|nr:IclR family transcriptional regulator [Pseudooceanicola pacificus]MWB77952.1 helix-turn-helix domain-containing protein [Pseudooceanicola pacificus]